MNHGLNTINGSGAEPKPHGFGPEVVLHTRAQNEGVFKTPGHDPRSIDQNLEYFGLQTSQELFAMYEAIRIHEGQMTERASAKSADEGGSQGEDPPSSKPSRMGRSAGVVDALIQALENESQSASAEADVPWGKMVGLGEDVFYFLREMVIYVTEKMASDEILPDAEDPYRLLLDRALGIYLQILDRFLERIESLNEAEIMNLKGIKRRTEANLMQIRSLVKDDSTESEAAAESRADGQENGFQELEPYIGWAGGLLKAMDKKSDNASKKEVEEAGEARARTAIEIQGEPRREALLPEPPKYPNPAELLRLRALAIETIGTRDERGYSPKKNEYGSPLAQIIGDLLAEVDTLEREEEGRLSLENEGGGETQTVYSIGFELGGQHTRFLKTLAELSESEEPSVADLTRLSWEAHHFLTRFQDLGSRAELQEDQNIYRRILTEGVPAYLQLLQKIHDVHKTGDFSTIPVQDFRTVVANINENTLLILRLRTIDPKLGNNWIQAILSWNDFEIALTDLETSSRESMHEKGEYADWEAMSGAEEKFIIALRSGFEGVEGESKGIKKKSLSLQDLYDLSDNVYSFLQWFTYFSSQFPEEVKDEADPEGNPNIHLSILFEGLTTYLELLPTTLAPSGDHYIFNLEELIRGMTQNEVLIRRLEKRFHRYIPNRKLASPAMEISHRLRVYFTCLTEAQKMQSGRVSREG